MAKAKAKKTRRCSVKARKAAEAKGSTALVLYEKRCGSVESSERSPKGSTSTDVRSPTKTSTEVRSPTSTSTEVRSPTSTSTSTEAYTSGNVTVTGGAGDGNTTVHIYPCVKGTRETELWTTRRRPAGRKHATDTGPQAASRHHYSALESLAPQKPRRKRK